MVAGLERLYAEPAPLEPPEFLARFVSVVGGDPSRLPPFSPRMLRHVRMLMTLRQPSEAGIPLDRLAEARFPVLVLSGGHSAGFDAVCDILEQRLGARRAVVEGARHSVPRTGKAYNDVVEAFWRSTPSR